MNTGIDIKYVEETYSRLTDDELIRIATQDASGMTAEAMGVVKAEIKKRGLGENISKGMEAQNKVFTVEELDRYCDLVSNLNCPSCGGTEERLNATMTGEVMSLILVTYYNKKLKIGCPHCLDKANDTALTKTLLLGWWGIPWGIFKTVQSITLNLKSKKSNHLPSHNDYLRGFALDNIGELEQYKDNKEMLEKLIARNNAL